MICINIANWKIEVIVQIIDSEELVTDKKEKERKPFMGLSGSREEVGRGRRQGGIRVDSPIVTIVFVLISRLVALPF